MTMIKFSDEQFKRLLNVLAPRPLPEHSTAPLPPPLCSHNLLYPHPQCDVPPHLQPYLVDSSRRWTTAYRPMHHASPEEAHRHCHSDIHHVTSLSKPASTPLSSLKITQHPRPQLSTVAGLELPDPPKRRTPLPDCGAVAQNAELEKIAEGGNTQ